MVIDDVFAVIAEATRREILASLRTGDKAVGELVEELAVSQPTVSKHLKVLREAGLVSMRAQGQKRFYSLNSGPLQEIARWLAEFDLPRAAGSADTRRLDQPVYVEPAAHLQASDLSAAAHTLASQDQSQQAFGRTVGRAAADLLAQFPKLRRRKE
ncbi:metalloregulator ArsR/SmtB family transcription factor [Arthrobacter sp. H5]|uniref:ArsR/SmtB family transcription factor n=1 Tax=Arthrobacter sp. H5 TaxID=1267973 RepID=UPI00048534AE|nr:metalloregulator ArsR/SmtB family transcription factor [Arthrobacter sp. H5]